MSGEQNYTCNLPLFNSPWSHLGAEEVIKGYCGVKALIERDFKDRETYQAVHTILDSLERVIESRNLQIPQEIPEEIHEHINRLEKYAERAVEHQLSGNLLFYSEEMALQKNPVFAALFEGIRTNLSLEK